MSNISKVSSSSSSPQASETLLESTSEHEDMEQGDTNDDDDEMYNSDEDSDSDSSSSRNRSDITNILISLNGPRLRYKVLSVSLSLLSPVFFPDNQILNLCKNCT